jgi:hypothetical protein
MISGHFSRLIQEEASVDGLLKGLRALSVCKHEAREMREQIVNKALENQKAKKS